MRVTSFYISTTYGLAMFVRPDPMMNLASLGVRHPSRGAHRIVKLWLRAIPADEKGLHEACMTKGASGIKPCLCCMHIIGRRRLADIAGDWAINLARACPDDVRQYDAEFFARMLEEVRRVMEDPASRVKDKQDIHMFCGVIFHPRAWASSGAQPETSRECLSAPATIGCIICAHLAASAPTMPINLSATLGRRA